MKIESFRFIIVGIINTIVGYAVFYWCLQYLNVYYPVALIISHIAGVINSYIWNSRWTFRKNTRSLKVFVKFMVIYGVTFLVNLIILSLLVNFLEFSVLFSQMIALFITTLISFFGHKFFSFK